ncbi:MAG: ribulose-phosphate 3-epimerase [Clostridiales bacterium]|nr:ribulose-phosphate 3-epimerase [Clostridiales bacterium]
MGNKRPVYVSGSILSGDFAALGSSVRRLDEAGADMIHIDVMDGVFVDNITIGIPVVAALRKETEKTFDVHLMTVGPDRYVSRFRDAGADIITIHFESGCDVSKTVDLIAASGAKPSLSVRPGTHVEELFPYLDRLYMALIMTVEPGFGGQAFIPETLEKVRLLREEADRRGLDLKIEVDGGINDRTAQPAVDAGADVIVSGSWLFGGDTARRVATIKGAAL